MAYDLATAKIRLKITDTTQDVEIQAALDSALEILEMYLDRKLMSAPETEKFYDVQGHTISLKRYPVTVKPTSTRAFEKMDMLNGLMHFAGEILEHEIEVTYQGGYMVLPGAIELALWSAFDTTWSYINPLASAPVSTTGIKAVTVPDVGKIEYDVSGASASAPPAAGSDFIPFFGNFMGILELYKRKLC